MAIKLGIIVTTGEPRVAAELAALAEARGWDGVFTWDGVAIGTMDTFDPWVVMAAMAMRTERVTLGAIVTPPARRRPWKLAREAMTLDRLSNGRLVLPVGLGTTDDAAFGNVGEPTEARIRAEKLDESLEILCGLWTGEPFGFAGRHYRFEPMTFRPTPVQQPRIPIWTVGAWPNERSMRRTLHWDGVVAQVEGAAAIREIVDWAEREWPAATRDRAWDVVAEGNTPADDPAAGVATVTEHAAAGATWWIESDWESGTVETIRRRIEAGPSRPRG
ncbi:MAG TPA: LLM class flavin-dependent oxidoreductase [Candidatus Limnocylindrales bacterium]|nr:LLM class flavin-dependent oxidoreductase [Candidatus Limnocylindrales bacterium]